MESREIMVTAQGQEAPFSRGILAQILSQAGASIELGYRVASEVRSELLAEECFVVSEEELLARVRARLEKGAPHLLSRLDKWRILRESSEPLVVLIGGATGVGTSTLAADLARRLNIRSVIGTDSVREVLRHAISPDLLPVLHKSSYSIRPEDIRVPGVEDHLLYGFRTQAAQVGVGIDAIVARGLKEGTNLVIEGIHLVPEMLMKSYQEHPNVCPLLVYLGNESDHLNRFYVRSLSTSMRRAAEEYVANFESIRRVHDYLLQSASDAGIPTIENASIEDATDEAVEVVVDRITEIAGSSQPRSPSLFFMSSADQRARGAD